MASEARLYTFSTSTRGCLKNLRMSTIRKPHPIARIFTIDKTTYEITPESDDEYTSLEDIVDELPDHVPRFVLLSYPVTKPDGRKATPYVLVAWMPVTTGPALRMLYAGAKELMRNTAEVSRVIDATTEDDVLGLEEVLKAL
ncbi:glia maturation factor beta [Ascodesmis nigricans]|uniref:Glia maturation factor beta n=1 Tax=Ascodesmis nigricans TaxID=341454 RepID=A0A4S2MSL1_9PEZI|nr:glia maturation factor beta [Ascodesmis nigricans]